MSSNLSKILIVEDDKIGIKILSTILGETYDLFIAKSGEKALKLISEGLSPDLILLDIMLPGIDGLEVCKTLKTRKNTQNIPVIFATAKREVEDLLKGFDVGGADYVTKPYNPSELLARVKTHIGLKLAREEIQTLRGIIPICSNCKKIRDDAGVWNRIEQYIEEHSDILFTHGICHECEEEMYGGQAWYEKMKKDK